MTEVLLRAARTYTQRGLSVLPVNPLGHENPKGPAIERWKQYQTRLATDDEIEEWWGGKSDYRLGIIGGRVSRGLAVLDIDKPWLAEAVRSDDDFMDGMVSAGTPSGGLHLYFRVRGGRGVHSMPYPNRANALGEIRSEGNYVVAPPSRGYKWEQIGPIPIIDDWSIWFAGFCERFGVSEDGKQTKGPMVRLSARLPDVISNGRHNFLLSEATRLHYKGFNEQEIFEALDKIDKERCKPPLGVKEIRRLSRWAGELPEKRQHELDDTGNAERLVERYGQNLRHSPGRGWFVWNGKRWLPDTLGQVYELAKETARSISDESDAEGVQKWAHASGNASRIREMVNLARSNLLIAVSDDVFDSSPWLLNVANGTLDLRTGIIKEPEREDFITKQISVSYEDAEGPTFSAFMRRILPDARTRGFVQRLFGYSITGDVSEQVFPIFYGEGGNGKSTLNNCILDIMGDYATQAAPGMFIQSRTDGSNEKAIALGDLQGIRLVFSFETDENKRLSEGLVKQATGGDRLTARKLFKGYFTFQPSHKVFLITNHLPRVTGMDSGIWRRIRHVPFSIKITEEERDRDLPKKLKEEYQYILKWLVAGCMAWQRHGLGEPEEVREATEEYRGESDIVGRFVDDVCAKDEKKSVQATIIYNQFKVWADREGERSYMTQNSFSRRLTALGFNRGKDSSGRRVWLGLFLKRVIA